jgi:OmcA/MtrC family decaheme c-type cytochrome
VDTASRCVACHGVFSKDFLVHGGIRNNAEYCVLCHNPSHDSLGRQPAPAAGQTAVTFPVDFKLMIHKIHRGENLSKDYLIFAPSGAATNVREFLFPGDLRHCQKCHVTDAQGDRAELLIPGKGVLGNDIQPTLNHQMDSSKRILETFETGPIKSACTACHDTDAALGHADLMTTPAGVETCVVCHGVGRDSAVDKVHAQ